MSFPPDRPSPPPHGTPSRRAAGLGLILLAGLAAPCAAASSNLQVVSSVVSIAVPAGSFNPATGLASVTVTRGLVLQVDASSTWKLEMRSTNASFTCIPLSGAGSTKPNSDLQVRSSGGGSTITTSTSYVQIANGGNTHGWSQLAFDVILNADTGDAAGLYSLNLAFALQ